MGTHDSHPPRRISHLIPPAVMALVGLVLAFGFAPGTAQSPQDEPGQADSEERRFENGIPAHVPLKVKLKNERAFKDRKNKEWARTFEIEVKNTGDKPIYFLYMIVGLPDFVLEDGNSAGFQVRYGRAELVDLEVAVRPDDVPILPGESITLALAERQWKGYESIRGMKNKPDAKKVELRMQMINFGDGTGFESNAGVFLTTPPKRSSLGSPPAGETAAARGCQPPATFLKASSLPEPASPLRVVFFLRESAPTLVPARACNCQNVPNCFFGKLQCVSHCPCGPDFCPFIAHVSTGNCSDPSGRCRQVVLTHEFCTTPNGTQTCSYDESVAPCGDGDPQPSPTPTPSETPTPTPAPTCDPATKPNDTNCFCDTAVSGVPPFWSCLCPGGASVERRRGLLLFRRAPER